MILHGLPILFALFLWWFSTGVILYLDRLPRHTFRWSMAGATGLAAGAIVGLTLISAQATIASAYAGFAIGLTVWGWLELGYYMGYMLGPRRQVSSGGSTGWRRFVHAAETTLYHELAALALAAVIAAVSWDMPNKVALWTFLLLWGMQLSAKLNVFLGVPNLAESFLPAHLAFLRHYMTRKPMNLLFPVSITLSMVLATRLVGEAAAAPTGFAAVGATMLSTLVVLAVLEHWFLVLPLPVEALWKWSLGAAAVDDARQPEPYARETVADVRAPNPLGRVFADPALSSPLQSLSVRRHR